MKHDLYSLIIEKLQSVYGMEDDNENSLYKYLKIRTAILSNKKKVNHIEMLSVALEDLNISIFKDDLISGSKIVYEDEDYFLYDLNREIMDNFEFRAGMYGNMNVKELVDEIFRKGSVKSTKFKKTKCYKKYVTFNRLTCLNLKFEANPTYSSGITGFSINSQHNYMRRSLEEILQAEIHSFEHGENDNTATITESQLEDFLVKNLEIIEKDLKYMGRQVDVPGGFIDILAKDSNDNICIIEIKINEDKNLIWQAIHYPKEIKNIYRSKNVRMITIAPEYNKSIYEALISIGNVEIFDYEIKVVSGKITELNVSKVLNK